MAKGSTSMGPADLSSDIPPVEALSSQNSTNLGPVDLSSDIPPVTGI